ncbi:MAG: hypothetical protein AUJ92_17075 [Armatimonadetes bacterium CG2_30_59_28]|nr:DegT/DnrJ/EryC1/StrS family aminotransferase [Armatimonadota bacterium]OIO91149.1 MAG: hypothetical protein AUJ92_17075 [Armatimonadetes bacterium CG2_30_59_28]PIU63982.1 MAG: hypothetical protein COS85_14260 [Armatimonadetes bacterium CG07_land_8_20_14_0_80_59_28]PIX44660.1 MAG: hypothetical protein COZ56_04015 [Armatimonadetes bacterium CG_4_8_14_3_um_filter_58_9]PIY43481.1 MAG: hypothetical protein COZ05_10970 [Armatimonadetes bacterium CG_4_10_14_3_um_filter_59_10]
MGIPLLDLKRQYQSIKPEMDAAALSLLEGCSFILGPAVEAFETSVARLLGAEHAVGVASGTDALTLALRAAGVGPGNEVVTTPFTFIATSECITAVGARPVFADVDAASFNISSSGIEEAITPRTKAIIPVHLYGLPAAMDAILAIADAHGLKVVEDTAQAFGASYKGKRAGTLGDAGCISFFPSKNLGGCGDGGMVVTNDDGIAKQVRILRQHGSRVKYHHETHGYNSRLDALQAALLQVKLGYIDEWNEGRRRKARRYNELFSDSPVVTPQESEDCVHVYHQYTIRVAQRERVIEKLRNEGIGHAIYYPIPLHLQHAYAELGYSEGDFPVSEAACREVLSLPIFPELTDEEQVTVATTILEGVD